MKGIRASWEMFDSKTGVREIQDESGTSYDATK